MNISFEHYKIFYYVAKYKSLSKAAQLLINNQPNLTRTIKNLENELDCRLFFRTNKGMILTPEGQMIYAHIKNAVEEVIEAENELSEIKLMKKGLVRISVSEIALRCRLLGAIKEYRRKYPDIRIEISNHLTAQAVESVRDSSADMALVTTPAPDINEFDSIFVCPVTESAICAKDFVIEEKEPLSLCRLSKYPLVSLSKNTQTYEFYRDIFSANSAEFNPVVETAAEDQIIPMVETGIGIGFVPDGFLKNEDNIRKIHLSQTLPQRNIIIVKKKNRPLSIAASRLEDIILNL